MCSKEFAFGLANAGTVYEYEAKNKAIEAQNAAIRNQNAMENMQRTRQQEQIGVQNSQQQGEIARQALAARERMRVAMGENGFAGGVEARTNFVSLAREDQAATNQQRNFENTISNSYMQAQFAKESANSRLQSKVPVGVLLLNLAANSANMAAKAGGIPGEPVKPVRTGAPDTGFSTGYSNPYQTGVNSSSVNSLQDEADPFLSGGNYSSRRNSGFGGY